MRLWGRATSINVQKVLWLIGELDLSVERIDVGGAYGGLDTPAFRALNPNGRIPVLEDEGLAVFESNAILRYLAATRGAGTLWRENPRERAVVDAWMDWSLTTPYPDFIACFWHTVRLPPSQRDPETVRAAARRLGETMRILDGWMASRGFLAGEGLSTADIAVGSLLYRYYDLPIDRPGLIHLETYFARLSERPAYRDAIMTSYESLRGHD